jgi:hypothetical protein
MILEYLDEEAGVLKVKDRAHLPKNNIIGIVTHLEKSEKDQYGALSR